MQLLNVHTFRLTTFYDQDVPRYAILSHTWEDEEILYQDICDSEKPLPQQKKGFFKLKSSCYQAACDGFDWIWIDTCCIDKSSSAELSEAINSMFRWYSDADICYAYISDVITADVESVRFGNSRWFTRGWTLQELIAPKNVVFFDGRWRKLGLRDQGLLANEVAKATGIPSDLLKRGNTSLQVPVTDLRAMLDQYSVAQRFSWASKRSTKRIEDEAYCLLGIFGVNMPLLYGEGSQAFFRLQQEILKVSDDQSILAFRHSAPNKHDLLAGSPRDYLMSYDIRPTHIRDFPHSHISRSTTLSPSAKILEMSLYLCPPLRPEFQDLWLGVLFCNFSSKNNSQPAILLEPAHHASSFNTFYRIATPHFSKVTPALGSVIRSRVDMTLQQSFPVLADEFDLSKADQRTVQIYFRKPLEVSREIFDSSPNMDVKAVKAWTPAVRLRLKGLPAPAHGRSFRMETQPCSLMSVPGAEDIQFYGRAEWGEPVLKHWQINVPRDAHRPRSSITLEACGAMVLEMKLPVHNNYTLPPMVAMVWGRNVLVRNSQGSYSCILLDLKSIVRSARNSREFDTCLKACVKDPKYRGDGVRAVALWLMRTCLSRPIQMDKAIIGVASVGQPAILSGSWGNYTFELASEGFLGQPLLDMVLSVKINFMYPTEDQLHKHVHELRGSFP